MIVPRVLVNLAQARTRVSSRPPDAKRYYTGAALGAALLLWAQGDRRGDQSVL